MTDDIILVL